MGWCVPGERLNAGVSIYLSTSELHHEKRYEQATRQPRQVFTDA